MAARLLVTVIAAWLAAGCTDIRDYSGTWHGARVGDAAPLRVGFAPDAEATLDVEQVDLRWLRARLTIDGDALDDALIQPNLGAEADVLSDVTFSGAPVRVYFAFAPAADGNGDPLVVVALYDDDRIEIRVMRGGPAPLYGIFALRRA